MSKTLLISLLVGVLLVLAGVGGFAFYKVQEAEAAAKAATEQAEKAEKEKAAARDETRRMEEQAQEEERQAEQEAKRSAAKAEKKRDRKIAQDVKYYGLGHCCDHQDPGSVYTWSYSDHKIIDREVDGDGNVTITLKITARAEPPIGRTKYPTSTHKLTFNASGERTATEVMAQTK